MTTALTPTQQEIQFLTPRALTDAAKRAGDFHGFTPRELDIYLTGQRDGMEAKSDACMKAMGEFLDAMGAAPTPIPVS